jgi:phosphoesterase RecJ-like protein
MENNTPKEILEALKSSNKPILCVDGRMDLDAYCSALAVYNIVKKLSGKKVNLFSSHPALTGYHLRIVKAFNIDLSEIKMGADPITLDFSPYDLQIFIDTGTIDHISQNTEFKADTDIKKVNIDHHVGNLLYGNYNYVKEYSSACSVFYEILKSENVTLDAYTAKLLLIGMLSDSSFLRNSNVHPQEFADIAELTRISGFQPYKLNEVMSASTIEDTKIRKIVYKNLVTTKGANFAYSFGAVSDYESVDLDPDFKGLPPVDVIKTIEGLDFVFFVREDKEKYNVSFRSVNLDFDIVQFATKLNGGGHKVAAAGFIPKSEVSDIQEAIQRVITLVSNS